VSPMPVPLPDPLATTRPIILVVDDEPLYLELIADILGCEYEILFASDGTSALDAVAFRLPHLVLLDLMMPGIDGYEVQKRLSADRRTCEIPVVFVTCLGDVTAETKGLQLGAADYISKPISPELLRARVNIQIKVKLTRDKFALLSETDGLTGLANRSHFDSMLAYEYARHMRSGTELSLLLLDIDQFKAFNDTYGHVRGDDCLRQIAQAMTTIASRATDLVARYGGEEFVLLLPETHLKGAVILAEKVRNCINDLAIPHIHSRIGHVTASLGVSSMRLIPGCQITDIVERADAQLYAAKVGGCNRVAYGAIRGIELTQ
jgi:diguanylate cyclase (GGDEF)-like protein